MEGKSIQKKNNIFSDIPDSAPKEIFTSLASSPNCKVERIISDGHSSPEGFWYDQEQNEWVLLLQGKAALLLEGKEEPLVLAPGDYVNIPARQKHRVEWTDSGQKTIWLAVHY